LPFEPLESQLRTTVSFVETDREIQRNASRKNLSGMHTARREVPSRIDDDRTCPCGDDGAVRWPVDARAVKSLADLLSIISYARLVPERARHLATTLRSIQTR